ncbi:MAG: hypothetical protein ACRD2L_02305, partial [Terriglobia bacterium]
MGSAHTARLDDLLLAKKSASDPEVREALLRLSSELKRRMERASSGSDDFFVSSLRALSRIKGSAQADLRLTCLCDCANYFYLRGNHRASVEACHMLRGLAGQVGSKPWMRRSESLLGVAYADIGSVAEALIHYAAGLELALEIEDKAGQQSIWINAGVALNYAGLYRESLPCFNHAARMAMEIPELRPLAAMAYTNVAQAYLYTDEFKRGFEAIKVALALSTEPSIASEALSRAIRECTYTQLAVELHEYEDAKAHAALCAKYGAWGDNRRGTAMALVASGLCE